MSYESAAWDGEPSAHVVQKFQAKFFEISEEKKLAFMQEKLSPFMTPREVTECIASYQEQMSLRSSLPQAKQLAGEAVYFSAWVGGSKKVFSLHTHDTNLELIITASA